MRILADESVEGEVVARLRSAGHDVAYIPETSAGLRDDEVFARANAENRVLLTEDKDFGDLAFFYGNRSSGIVLLRAHGADVAAKASLVAEVLETHEDELTKDPPHFVVLRWGRPPRSRPLRTSGPEGRFRCSGRRLSCARRRGLPLRPSRRS